MNGHVGHAVLRLEAGALGHVAVAGLDEQGRAQLAGVDDALHLRVAPVVPAHEAHLDQPFADLLLPGDNLLAVPGVLAQGLLAEAPLFVFQYLHHVVVMGGVDGGDDHRLHLGVCDHAVAVVPEGTDAVPGRRLVGGGSHIVADSNHGCTGNGLNDPAAVVLPDGPAADDADFEHGVISSF